MINTKEAKVFFDAGEWGFTPFQSTFARAEVWQEGEHINLKQRCLAALGRL